MIEVAVQFDDTNYNTHGLKYDYILYGTLNEADMSGSIHLNGECVFEVKWEWARVARHNEGPVVERVTLWPRILNNGDRFWHKSRCGRLKLNLMVNKLCSSLEKHLLSGIMERE